VHVRPFDKERDREATQRIWLECGWLEPGEDDQLKAMDIFVDSGPALVAELEGKAECLVCTAPGTLRHQHAELPFSSVTAVTTSRIARKRGLAGRLTARGIATSVARGALVSGLGIFDQGYYDLLGYGSGTYEHIVRFDPAHLRIDHRPGIPCRLTGDDWQAVHASRVRRRQGHGAVSFDAPQITHCEVIWGKKGFGLGYRDPASGELTHHFWCRADEVENGPYRIAWMSYRSREQFLDLMALVASLGDQVHQVQMVEPAGVQLQDLLDKPLRQQSMSRQSKVEMGTRAVAYWQMRICDLAGCLERTELACGPLRFNLRLRDPIERFLAEDDGGVDHAWRGVGGDYVVTLGPSSSAEPGTNASLPTLEASVGAFTRLWLGVRPASGLAVTDDLSGPPELLAALELALRLPAPHPDWDF
jgi:hypothetical protein